MPALQWNENLETKINWQDNQHKELFNKINDLLDAMGKGKSKDEVGNVFKFLENYVVFHFAEEEKQMTQFNFPGLNSHKTEHTKFKTTALDLKSQLEKEGPSATLAIKTQRILVDWLTNHIGKIDKILGEFLKTKS